MGALTESRKRLNDVFSLSCAFPPPYSSNLETPPLKKPRISSVTPIPEKPLSAETSQTIISKFRSLPPPPPLLRTVHAPQRNRKFFGSVNSVRKSQAGDKMGNFQSTGCSCFQQNEFGEEPSGSLRNSGSVVNAIAVEADQPRDVITEGLSIEEYKRLVEERDVNLADSNWDSGYLHSQEPMVLDPPFAPSSTMASEFTVLMPKTEYAGKMTNYAPVNHAVERTPACKELYESSKVVKTPVYKELYESSKRRDSKLSSLDFEVRLAEQKISTIKLEYPVKEAKEVYDFARLLFICILSDLILRGDSSVAFAKHDNFLQLEVFWM